MAEHPEFPFLAAGAVSVLGATIRDKKLPELTTPVIGTVALVLLASATAESRFAPLVRAIGFLLLLSASMAAVNVTLKKANAKKRK